MRPLLALLCLLIGHHWPSARPLGGHHVLAEGNDRCRWCGKLSAARRRRSDRVRAGLDVEGLEAIEAVANALADTALEAAAWARAEIARIEEGDQPDTAREGE